MEQNNRTEEQIAEQTGKLAKKIYGILDSKKAEDITIIDIRAISVISDYFIIASVSNQNQMQALMDAVDEEMYKNGITSKQVEGNKNSTWVLMDYEDIIIHIFAKEDRLFYDLERIWQDGVVVNPRDIG